MLSGFVGCGVNCWLKRFAIFLGFTIRRFSNCMGRLDEFLGRPPVSVFTVDQSLAGSPLWSTVVRKSTHFRFLCSCTMRLMFLVISGMRESPGFTWLQLVSLLSWLCRFGGKVGEYCLDAALWCVPARCFGGNSSEGFFSFLRRFEGFSLLEAPFSFLREAFKSAFFEVDKRPVGSSDGGDIASEPQDFGSVIRTECRLYSPVDILR